MTHWYIGGDGQRLAADHFGSDQGTPVLLLGGMGQTRHSWRRAAQRLADGGRRAITLDIRGHGESDRAADENYGYARHVADMTAVAREIGRPLVVAGNSLGGKIALATAASTGPETVAALVMVDAAPRSRPEGISNVSQSMQVSIDGFASLDEAVKQIAASKGEPVQPGAAERLRRNMRQDEAGHWHWHWDSAYFQPRQAIGGEPGRDYLEALAPQVTVPTLLAWCELSEMVDADGVAALRALIPQLEVEVIPGAHHMIVGDQNDVFADALLRFLDRTGV